MGVVSNGMLCSGDELGLTADADGILILAPETPLGARLADLYGDVVLDVDVKPNRGDALSIVGLAREVAAVTGAPVRMPPTEIAEDGSVRPRTGCGSRSTSAQLCPALRRPVDRWRDRRAVARLGADAAARRRHAPDQQRRRCHELRDARAGQADPRLRRRRVARPAARRDRRPPGARGRDDSRPSTTSTGRSTPDTLLIADPRGPIGIAGVMGGAGDGGGRRDDRGHPGVGDLRPGDHPPDRPSATRFARDASLRFEKGQEFRLARVGADRATRLITEWAGGRAAAGVVDTNPTEPATRRVAFRPARVDRLLGTSSAARPSGRSSRVSGSRRSRPTGRSTSSSPRRSRTEIVPRPRARRFSPPCRRGAATSRSRPTLPRRSPASTATSRSPAPARDPDADGARRPLAARDAIREALVGAGLTEVVSYALVSSQLDETFAWLQAPGPRAARRPRGRVDHGRQPALERPLDPAPDAHREPASRSCSGTSVTARRRRRLRGRQGLRAVRRRPDEWWRLGSRWRVPPSRPPGTAPAATRTSTTRRASSTLIARLIGAGEPATGRSPTEPMLHPGRSATVEAASPMASPRSPAPSASSIRAWPRRGTSVGRVIVAELSVAGLGGGSLPGILVGAAAARASRSSATSRSTCPVASPRPTSPPGSATPVGRCFGPSRSRARIAASRSGRTSGA